MEQLSPATPKTHRSSGGLKHPGRAADMASQKPQGRLQWFKHILFTETLVKFTIIIVITYTNT